MTLEEMWNESLPDLQLSIPFDLAKHTVAVFRVGSHSHGTYIPPEDKFGVDDVDLMVICVPPVEMVLGMKRWEHGQYKHGKLDVVFYDWSKWLHLLHKSNPNVVGTLWLENEDMFFPQGLTWSLQELYHKRGTIISQEMYPAFVGYARGQMHKMTHFVHQGYMGAKRKELVEEYGYDVKNAAHMIRLLRMACETLETGKLNVRRTHDAEFLKEIKQGKHSLAFVMAEATSLLERATLALSQTAINKYPDDALLQRGMIDGYLEQWNAADDGLLLRRTPTQAQLTFENWGN